MKGDGETHPILSPEDEFADFETWDFGDSFGNPKEAGMLQYEYARSTLKNGIRLEDKLGVNPFKYGMIGSTDTHVSLTTTREENYFGKLPDLEPRAKRYESVFLRDKKTGAVIVSGWQCSASGLAAVWAHENTREVDLRRLGPQGGLRHQRYPHDRADLRRLGFQARGGPATRFRQARLRSWGADGRRSDKSAGGCGAEPHDPGDARSGRRQSRPGPGHQGLAGFRREDSGAHL